MTTPSEHTDEILALYALGVPVDILARDYGMTVAQVHRFACDHKVKRPAPSDKALLNRVARTERIKRHVAEYPSQPMFSDIEAAA